MISLEHHLGIFHEATIQHWAQHFTPLIVAANYFYGSLHFIVTIFTGVFLYRRFTDDYPRFRNMLGITTAVALIGFTFYPLVPPRLLAAHYGFHDTLAQYPTFWSFNSGGMSHLSNQYAAMPSVHIAWSTWCALALVPRLKSRTGKVLAFCYPFCTLIVIVITANHYVIDAVGGLLILAIGYVLSGIFTRAGRVRRTYAARLVSPACDRPLQPRPRRARGGRHVRSPALVDRNPWRSRDLRRPKHRLPTDASVAGHRRGRRHASGAVGALGSRAERLPRALRRASRRGPASPHVQGARSRCRDRTGPRARAFIR